MPENKELKRANFEMSARNYMKKTGMDEQAGDYEAYFDPTLTHNENMEIFKKGNPAPTHEYASRVERDEAIKYRLEAIKEEIEHKKRAKEQAKEERKQFAEEQIRKGKEPGELDFAMEDLEKEERAKGPRTPSLLDKAQGFYSNLKGKYAEHQERSLKEREYKAKQRYAKYAREERIKELEARSGYSAGSRLMSGLADFAKNPGLGARDRGLLGSSLQNSKPAGISLLTSGSNPGGLYSLIGGQSIPQGKPRSKYLTVIEKGIARRVKVPVEGQAQGPAPGPVRGALESHIYGTQDKSPLFGMVGTSNSQKSGLSGLIGNKSGSMLGFNTSRKSALSPGMGKSRLSVFSGGKKKSIWRV